MSRTIAVLIVFLFSAFYSSAQQLIDARGRFDQGEYEAAISFCEVLLNVYHDKGFNTSEVIKLMGEAKRCLELKAEAGRLSKKNYYTKAIEYYKEIQSINPLDPNISKLINSCRLARDAYKKQKGMESDWEMAKSLSQLYAFRKKYPASKYDKAAQEIIKKLEIKADADRWRKANENWAIDSYEKYLAESSEYSQFVKEAKRRLAALYETEGDNIARRQKDYGRALECYEKSEKYGGMTCPSDIYEYCKFKTRVGYKNNKRAIKVFLERHPDSKYIEEVRGYWVFYLIDYEKEFDLAKKIVRKEDVSLDGKIMKTDWWIGMIKYKEAEYKKELRKARRR